MTREGPGVAYVCSGLGGLDFTQAGRDSIRINEWFEKRVKDMAVGSVKVKKAAVRAEEGVTEPEMMGALDGEIGKVKVGIGYQMGLAAVTAVMVLLPVVYVGLVGAVAYGVYWHAVNDAGVFDAARGATGMKAAAVAYVMPLVIGVVLVGFMVKPLFARRGNGGARVTLSFSEQRKLYAFVSKLCGVVGSRVPCRIDVDCDVNASASFRNGWRGLVTGEVVLTIGLPLVAGLSMRELTGVLAHEFGHFAQGTGMKLTFIVRSINAWFSRVVYERDAWDESLENFAKGESHWAIILLAWGMRLAVWVTRRVLWVLMWVGHFTSSFMLRQMEFDADRYAARVVGSDGYAAMSERVTMLSVARNAAFHDLSGAWKEKRLCDDLSKLIAWREKVMPADVRVAIRKAGGTGKTGWFDSHPCDAARLASVVREEAKGIFRLEGPAVVLVEDFAGLSRRVTRAFYEENIGKQFRPEHVVTTDALVSQAGKQEEAYAALGRFFQGLIDPRRPVFPRRLTEVPAEEAAVGEMLLMARSKLIEAAPEAREAGKKFVEADDKVLEAMRTQMQRRAGQAGGTEAMRAAEQKARGERGEQLAVVSRVINDAMVRIDIVLALEERGRRRGVVRAPDEGEGGFELAEEGAAGESGDLVVDALAAISSTWGVVEKMRGDYHCLGALIVLWQKASDKEGLGHMIVERGKVLHAGLMELHRVLRGAVYPYEHAEKGVTLAKFALEEVPAVENVGRVYGAAETAMEAVYGLYMRMMSDLARRGEELERGFGLEAMAEVGVEER